MILYSETEKLRTKNEKPQVTAKQRLSVTHKGTDISAISVLTVTKYRQVTTKRHKISSKQIKPHRSAPNEFVLLLPKIDLEQDFH